MSFIRTENALEHYEVIEWGNDHLIEFQLIEIVFYHLIKILLITWPNFTWPNQLIESSNNGILSF